MSTKRLLALLAAVGGAAAIGVSPAYALYDDEGLTLTEDSAAPQQLASDEDGLQQPVGASASYSAEGSIGGSSGMVEVKVPSGGGRVDD